MAPSEWEDVAEKLCAHSMVAPSHAKLELEHVYGRTLSPDCFLTADDSIVYFAAALGIVYDAATKTQLFFRAHADDVTALAIHKSHDKHLEFVATASIVSVIRDADSSTAEPTKLPPTQRDAKSSEDVRTAWKAWEDVVTKPRPVNASGKMVASKKKKTLLPPQIFIWSPLTRGAPPGPADGPVDQTKGAVRLQLPVEEQGVVSERFPWIPLRYWLFTPELQWQSKGKWRILQWYGRRREGRAR